LFLTLLEKSEQKSNFQPRLAELGLTRGDRAETGIKYDFQELKVVLYDFYIKLPLIKLISSLN